MRKKKGEGKKVLKRWKTGIWNVWGREKKPTRNVSQKQPPPEKEERGKE